MSFKNYIENIPDSPAITTSSLATIGAATTSFFSWLGTVNWVAVVSILVAVIGLIANVFFSWRRDKREKKLLEHNIKRGNCE